MIVKICAREIKIKLCLRHEQQTKSQQWSSALCSWTATVAIKYWRTLIHLHSITETTEDKNFTGSDRDTNWQHSKLLIQVRYTFHFVHGLYQQRQDSQLQLDIVWYDEWFGFAHTYNIAHTCKFTRNGLRKVKKPAPEARKYTSARDFFPNKSLIFSSFFVLWHTNLMS